MRIVASVQAKRGSSRGLIHYLSHSKLDIGRESEKGRELFNSFTNDLSVESANNSLKIGIAKTRPSNDELHHLVLSFKPEDYRALGREEKARRRAVKEVVRSAMKGLESALSAERLYWAAAVHLNTENPHIHIALQKQYFTKEIERRVLAKIPREALPHYETLDGEKVLTQGLLIEGATEKMEQFIDRNRERSRSGTSKREWLHSEPKTGRDLTNEREILRQGFLAEYELHRIESRIDQLMENRNRMRFVVTDPETGRKTRLSLQDIEQRKEIPDTGSMSPQETQIRTILFKMLAKEEKAKAKHQSETKDTVREADRVKERYRKNDWKLPAPAFTKDEIDRLQESYIQASDLRKFSYLENVRSELERSGEIGPRDKAAFGRIAALETIADLRKKVHERTVRVLTDKRYYRHVEIEGKLVSLNVLDRDETDRRNPVLSFLEKVKEAGLRLSGKTLNSSIAPEAEKERLRKNILKRLDEHSAAIKRDLRTESRTVKTLEKILIAEQREISVVPVYSPEELAEINTLSLRLKAPSVYEENRDHQRALIEAAGRDCSAYRKLLKADPAADFNEHKRNVIGGRALAGEIVARIDLEKAKEELNVFSQSKRFQKFAIEDKKSGAIEFVSLHDVDLPRRGSFLDRAMDELFENREHRHMRRKVSSLVNAREERLKSDLNAGREILASASREASEFTRVSFLGLRGEPVFTPIFSSAEFAAIKTRIAGTQNSKEAERLRGILQSAVDQPVRSLGEILRDFENRETIPTREKDYFSDPNERVPDGRIPEADKREQSLPDRPREIQRSDDRTVPDFLR